MSERPRVELPQLCGTCQSLIVHGARFRPEDRWQVLIVTVNIALFREATNDDWIWQQLRKHPDGKADASDLTRVLGEVGCLGCYFPKSRDALTEEVLIFGLSKVAERIQTAIRP